MVHEISTYEPSMVTNVLVIIYSLNIKRGVLYCLYSNHNEMNAVKIKVCIPHIGVIYDILEVVITPKSVW